jgi:hypothetical protein
LLGFEVFLEKFQCLQQGDAFSQSTQLKTKPGSPLFFSVASKIILIEQIARNVLEYDEHIVRQQQLAVNLTQICKPE